MINDKKKNDNLLSRLNVLVTIPVNSIGGLDSHIKILRDYRMTFALIMDKNNKVFLARRKKKDDPLAIIHNEPIKDCAILDYYYKGKLVT